MNWMKATPAEIDRRLELAQLGTIKLHQAGKLTRAAIECRPFNHRRADRFDRFSDRLRKRGYRLIQGIEA